MLISFRRFLGNTLSSLFPSSFFSYRRLIIKFMGVSISDTTKVNIGFKIYGAGKVSIGHDTWIGPNCHIYTAEDKGVSIGNNCDIAPEVTFICGSHIQDLRERRAGTGTAHSVEVGDGTWVCARSTIHSSIGKMAIIGTGAVVLEQIPDNVLAVGIPAKIKKDL